MKGYIIDCDYLISVKELMEADLLHDYTSEVLPIITVEVE